MATVTRAENSLYDQIAASFPETITCQRILMVAVVACSILSLIPPLRIGATIAMRGVALISSLASFQTIDPKNQVFEIAQNVARCAIIVLGIAAIASASPLLLTISIVMDLAMQAFLCIKALYEEDYNAAALHFGMLTIDTLAVAALVTGSWQIMIAAAAASVVAMASITVTSIILTIDNTANPEDTPGRIIENLCYLALMITGCVAISQMVPVTQRKIFFKLHNDTPSDKNYYMYNDLDELDLVATLKPGEQKEILYQEGMAHCILQESSDPYTRISIRTQREITGIIPAPGVTTSQSLLPPYSLITNLFSRWISPINRPNPS